MGRRWTPYQRYMAEVAGELDARGEYAHHTVVITMPRQCAKTTTAYDVGLGRGGMYRDYRARYATHKGTITSERYVDWFNELERQAAVIKRMKLRRSRGTESVGWRRTGSYFQAFPARDGALRSAALDLVVVDEAQEHDDALGGLLKRQITATFNTRPRHQLWVVFSAGIVGVSTYAAEYLRRGIAGEPGIALFDYGCPEHVDPTDPALWRTWHPGLAYGLTSESVLHQALAEDEAGFVREYGNIWSRTVRHLIDPTAWKAATAAPAPMPPGHLGLGVDVAADRSTAAIAIYGPRGRCELIDHRPYGDWVIPRVIDLARRHQATVAIDTVGPAGTVRDALQLAAADPAIDTTGLLERWLLPMAGGDVANAAAGFIDDVHSGGLHVWPHPDLDAAVEVVTARPSGDAGFGFSRRASGGNIAPLVALAAARWARLHHPGPPPAPQAHAY